MQYQFSSRTTTTISFYLSSLLGGFLGPKDRAILRKWLENVYVLLQPTITDVKNRFGLLVSRAYWTDEARAVDVRRQEAWQQVSHVSVGTVETVNEVEVVEVTEPTVMEDVVTTLHEELFILRCQMASDAYHVLDAWRTEEFEALQTVRNHSELPIVPVVGEDVDAFVTYFEQWNPQPTTSVTPVTFVPTVTVTEEEVVTVAANKPVVHEEESVTLYKLVKRGKSNRYLPIEGDECETYDGVRYVKKGRKYLAV